MALKNDKLYKDLVSIIELHEAKNEEDFVNKIVDELDKHIKFNAEDYIYGNTIIKTNPELLKKAWTTGFLLLKSNITNSDLIIRLASMLFTAGINLYWLNSQLSYTILPPGTTSVVANFVVAPSPILFPIELINTDNPGEIVENIIRSFRFSMQAMTGITIAMVPGTPPIPTLFYWHGLS